jgi:ech hydrogenase subunit F
MSISDISKLIFKSGLSKPATRRYPFKKRDFFPRTRGHIRVEIEKCSMCTLCDKKCPTGAIKVAREEKTWSIDRLKCIQCNYCVEVCPKKCLYMENKYSDSTAVKETELFKQEIKPQDIKPQGS